MFIVLPDKEKSLKSIENKLAISNFETITAGLEEVGRVRLKLPMFKIEMTIDVKALLQKVSIIFLRRYLLSNAKEKCRFL